MRNPHRLDAVPQGSLDPLDQSLGGLLAFFLRFFLLLGFDGAEIQVTLGGRNQGFALEFVQVTGEPLIYSVAEEQNFDAFLT